jgi:uncharacterized membrane protein YbaN (DUF454 family)
LAALGLVSAALALVGVFVPGLPTTVFAIAASYLFAKSSPRLDCWLRQNRWLGPPLQQYVSTGGMTLRGKGMALAAMWTGLTISWFTLARFGFVPQVLTIFLGMVGTAAILFCVRTVATTPPTTASSRQAVIGSLLRVSLPYAPGSLRSAAISPTQWGPVRQMRRLARHE